VNFFVYGRDRPDTDELRDRTTEAHWSFMDGYAEGMIARGPTLTPDGAVATGSLHIVDLPDLEAARAFAFDEPYYRAGVFAAVIIRRWRNDLGRTMWDFEGDDVNNRRFLVIGHGTAGGDRLDQDYRRYIADQDRLGRVILAGPLLSEDGAEWAGTATMIEVPERSAVDALMAGDPCAQAGLYEEIEIHDWEFGGRR
jgi:uncharacterized protein YciI